MQAKILLIALGIGIGAAALAGQPPQVEYSADTNLETGEMAAKHGRLG